MSTHEAMNTRPGRYRFRRHQWRHLAMRHAPWTLRTKVVASILGAAIAGNAAYATTNWAVSLSTGSSGEAQSATVANLTITAVASPAAGNLLYPGGNGDVVITISNPNPFPVSVSAVNLPTSSTDANGYTTSALTTTQAGCLSSTPSGVTWNYATATSGSSHTLTTALVIGASGASDNPLTVTLTNDASMATTSPAACENTYFSMPSLTGVTATATSGSTTASPATDAWTS